jgi:hypothetical protein
MSFNYKEYLRDNPLLKEGKYEEFLEKEQDIFTQKPSYNDYIKQVEPIMPKNDKSSTWLFNHHAAEMAWEENKVSQAKKHIDLAMKNNIGNSITFVLDFIINNKGTKEQLLQGINQMIPNKTEKETALQLLDDPKYGGKLK